jgi:hypothetical protein
MPPEGVEHASKPRRPTSYHMGLRSPTSDHVGSRSPRSEHASSAGVEASKFRSPRGPVPDYASSAGVETFKPRSPRAASPVGIDTGRSHRHRSGEEGESQKRRREHKRRSARKQKSKCVIEDAEDDESGPARGPGGARSRSPHARDAGGAGSAGASPRGNRGDHSFRVSPFGSAAGSRSMSPERDPLKKKALMDFADTRVRKKAGHEQKLDDKEVRFFFLLGSPVLPFPPLVPRY